jgi:hypothetical protein
MLVLRMLMLIMMAGLFISLLIIAAYAIGRRIEHGKSKGKMGELPSDAGVRDMLLEGQIQEAVEAYRKFTGVDEYTAKKAIDDMLRDMRLDDASVRDDVRKLLRAGNKAGAIEAYQAATGVSLAEALAFVESYEKRSK